MSTVVAFFATTSFSLLSIVTSQEEDDDLLVYFVSSLVPTLALVHVKPPITQVYSLRQNPPICSLTPTASSLDLIHSHDLPIALCKGKR